MTKHFCELDSEGPSLVNFQLEFWRLAVARFDEIQANWDEFAVEDGEENENYTNEDFVVDAAVALVLAGTSVAELIGQNIPANGSKTEHLRPAYRKLVADPIPGDVESLFQIYDNLRHFGPAKHNAISQLTEEDFCQHMTAAQGVWTDVLKRDSDDFRHKFKFGE